MAEGSISFVALEKALSSLMAALNPPPRNDRERDGAIQRFKYTFELTWKVAKKILESQGIVSPSPKSTINDLAKQGWITSADRWMGFLQARNYALQLYHEIVADRVFVEAQIFGPECQKLLEKMKSV